VTLIFDLDLDKVTINHLSTSFYPINQILFKSETHFVNGWTDIETGFMRSSQPLYQVEST